MSQSEKNPRMGSDVCDCGRPVQIKAQVNGRLYFRCHGRGGCGVSHTYHYEAFALTDIYPDRPHVTDLQGNKPVKGKEPEKPVTLRKEKPVTHPPADPPKDPKPPADNGPVDWDKEIEEGSYFG